MTDFLTQNLQVLGARQPALAEKIAQAEDASVQLLENQGPLPDLKIYGTGFYGETPEVAVEKFWKDQKLSGERLLIFYGFGLGYPLKYFLKYLRKPLQEVLIIERSAAAVRLAFSLQDWKEELQDVRIEWWIGEDPERSKNGFHHYYNDSHRFLYCRSQQSISWLPALKVDGKYYLEMAQALADASAYLLRTQGADPEDYFRGTLNFVDNLPRLKLTPLLNQFQNIAHGLPGIIVSTGPSLNASLPILREIQDRAVIYSADSALQLLVESGIHPHFAGTLERVYLTERFFRNLPDLPDTYLVAPPLVYPKTLKTYRGPQLFLHSPGFPCDAILGRAPSQFLGPSVATMGFQVLNLLGCNPIILVGQDLAYERASGRSHAKGAHPELEVTLQNSPEVPSVHEIEVEGNNGAPIRTTSTFQYFAQTFEMLIQSSGKTCLNAIALEYGMKIPGTQRIEPSALAEFVSPKPVLIASQMKERFKTCLQQDSSAWIETIQGQIKRYESYLTGLCTQATAMLEDWARFFHEHQSDPIDEKLRSLYLEKIDAFYEQVQQMTHQNPEFFYFFYPHILPKHLWVSMRYHELRDQKGSFDSQLMPLYYLWKDWAQEVVLWTSRVSFLFQKVEGRDACPG